MMQPRQLIAVMLLAMATFGAMAEARSDAVPDNPSAADIQIKGALPLSAKDSYEKKFLSYQSAMDDYDFRRVITLFTSCAEAGDALCQYFLADGVSQWLWYDFYPHDKAYNAAFVRKWLRRASSDFAAYNFVTQDWASFYHRGRMGFPQDSELYHCWREVANANNDMSRAAVESRFNSCKALERKKYGSNAPWLTD